MSERRRRKKRKKRNKRRRRRRRDNTDTWMMVSCLPVWLTIQYGAKSVTVRVACTRFATADRSLIATVCPLLSCTSMSSSTRSCWETKACK
jgi:hypothetical protein